MEKEVETSLFSLPPELLCGISCYLPGEELRQFGTTCTRLKTIADRTAVGRIAYLLRKSEPLWARLHRGAIRHGMRSPTAILEFMEGKTGSSGYSNVFFRKTVQMRLAHTKNTDPIIVTLDTGNPDHSVDSVDHLEDVNLFDSPKFPAQIRIEKDLAAAAFFNRLPKLTVYTWNLAAEPTKSPSSSEIGPIWRRPPTRTVALDLSNFDIFDDDIPILGDVQICAKFVAVYLGCIGVVVVVDMQRDRDVSVKVHRTSQSVINFRGFFVENETHFFAFEEADDWIDEFTPAFLTFYSAKDGRQLEEYLKIDELLSSPHGIKRLNDKVFVVSEKRRNFFHVVTLDKESPVARHFAFRHEIESCMLL
ncbi:Oidioi.mRNA.OKI2018_I69.chr2.g4026.t2.cds [Oikopleura dioica]|uniref:Oidioi.mRNA.OKI2018_I69.chr2.g4026.t2.cds n=1 Tax=Oikopleura dioica TaxID=34765 RepID=A0ABN7T087_OIKDI|nr:Oidioi.mRNA.OKI2018_I69.chr2.g4026.t2.cds [Oikopleura dioica]